ncbi:hypothetical protein PLESTB_001569300 [Pleodorina starrii]|uniref:Kinesin motor domain-containing protein n=1 Tax=Pleodorina starrii TaxID=330485 RepID=A0A9W6BXI0_9CHLO|nr:hypothetical protein PLESTB_001569300 [Pleodorina starrii]GLC72710.1 hypothetical protein PLESTF_001284800 [Pleodorina starrii]
MPRVSALIRWNSAVVESRKNAIDYAALDHFRQEVLSQEELYESSVRSFVNRCLQGCSGSIITYGAWGSGKSYTLGALDPQQLALDTPGNEAAGVLPRCTQQLYEWLGQGASVEITCVEVQGDDVVDLLDQWAGTAAFSRGAGADAPAGVGSSTCTNSSAGLGPGGASAAQEPFARSAIAVAAAGAATGSRRKPLTVVVARSLSEALATLKHAVANRQAFVTSSRHSSSRTHAVFQLRWRNPAVPAAGGGASPTTTRAAGPQASGGGVAAQRAYSAPPRAALPTGPAGSPASAAAGGQPPPGAGPGPICTLTLVDTCSFCPLLPPKEGSAVKRSLLALSRVLTALQRRQALTLRESKLTRMLEGTVDQVLVLACLGGSGDEPTVHLARMLQQGVPRDSDLRRSRRASSSESTRLSATWEAQPHTSVFSVGSVKIASSGGTVAAGAPPRPSASSAKCSLGGKATGPILGPGPARSIFHSPASPPVSGYGARSVVATRTECPHGDSAEGDCAGMGGVAVDAGDGRGNTSCGGGTVTDAYAGAAHPLSSLEVSSSSSSTAAFSRSEEAAADAAAATAASLPSAVSPSAKTARQGTLTIDVHMDATEASASASPDGATGGRGRDVHVGSGGGGAAAAAATAMHEKRSTTSVGGGGAAVGRRPSGSIASPQGTAAGASLSRRLSPRLVSPQQKPSPVSARVTPSSEVRRSQGYSVLAGKWSPPPPPVSPRASSFPTIPCILMPHDGASAAPSRRSSLAPAATAANIGRAGSVGVSGRQPCSNKHSARAASGPPAWGSPAAVRGYGGSAATPRSVVAGSGITGGGGGSASPFAALMAATSTVDPPGRNSATPLTSPAGGRGGAAGGGSPPSAVSTPTRRKSGIPARPPVRSPQPLMQSPFAAAGVGPAAPRSAHRPVPRSPSPATVVSLAAVRPTLLASMRYGNANSSHDSAPDGVASAAAASVLLDSRPMDVDPAALARTSIRRQQTATPSAVAAASLAAADGPDGVCLRSRFREVGALAAAKRSVSSGLRWPSPLLRARRAEWLSDLRRSRSALPRPVSQMPEAAEGDAASPRQLRGGGFRCAVLGRPTLSAQYKDLLHDFEAFKAIERLPRQRHSVFGGAAPPMPSAASAPPTSTVLPSRGPAENPSPVRLFAADPTASSPAASRLQAPGPAPKPGTSMPTARGAAAATALSSAASPSPRQQGFPAPGGSPAVSTGLLAANSPAASISTPRSARPASGGCVRLPPAFSRAHSPSADEGLLSLTAAAAVVAASPRTPASGGALPSGRPRPGISRAGGATVSPRPLRSPENPATPVSPVMVLDMSRLFAGKGSPSAAPPPPLSGRSRLSASSVHAAAAAGQLASGGSDRYRRLVEQDPDSDHISEVEADPDLDRDRGHSNAGSDPCAGSDSDRDNLLGPGCLGHLGLMLDTGGDVAALRNSISKLGDSGRALPAVAAVGAAATASSPSPLRRATAASVAAAAIAAEAAAISGCPSDGGDPDGPGEELPAVSFFICQFTPRVQVGVGGGTAAEAQRPAAAAAASGAPCVADSAAGVEAAQSAPTETPVRRERASAVTPQETAGEVVAGGGELQPELEELTPPTQQQQARRRRSPGREAAAGISAVALADLQSTYTLQDRASVESCVLRGSCTPFAVDGCGDEAIAAANSSAGGHAPLSPSPPPVGMESGAARGSGDGATGRGEAVGAHGSAESPAVQPPSESCISLRQLLEQQELLLLQQRLGRRSAGLAASPGAPAPVGGQGTEPGKGGGTPSAAMAASVLLAQLAHVRPNHVDLDEQSNVLVDIDSASESEVAVDAVRRVPATAPLGSRPGSANASAVRRRDVTAAASPSGPSALPQAIQAPSPVKPLRSPSPAQSPLNLSKKSSGRARIAAHETPISPITMRAGATPRVVHSWAHVDGGDGGGGGHRSPAAAALAAAAAAATAQGGAAADGARRGSAHARSSPSPSSAIAAKANAEVDRRVVSGSGPVPPCRAAPVGGGAGHARHPSDSAIGGGGSALGSQALLWRGLLGRTDAVAAVTVSPPPSPPPPPLQVMRSIETDGAARQPLPLPPAPPSQQQQLHSHLHQPPPPPAQRQQQQQPLRGSGNVAAAWRAAAAMTTSSSSSVRSCFRSSSGPQQQQPQQHSVLGSDATAVATVVALSRAPGSCCDDKHHATLAIATGHATATASKTAIKLSGGAERLQSSGNTVAAAAPTAVAVVAPPAAIAAAPPLPPDPSPAPNPFLTRSVSPGPVPAAYVLPLALPPQPQPPAPEPKSAAPFAALLAKAKSSRGGERSFPLTARLRACKSHRTPRSPPAAAAASGGSGGAAAPPVEEVAEEPPPPPAYPPGFVSWATRLFSGSRKSKRPP